MTRLGLIAGLWPNRGAATYAFGGILAAGLVLWAPAAFAADALAEIRSAAALDEPRGFCVDMVGSQARAAADRPLQAHTCYAYQGRIAVDQGVSLEDTRRGLLRFPHFGVCLVGAAARAGGAVVVAPCAPDAAPSVAFDGPRIKPMADAGLCLTIAGGASRPGNGGAPPHLIRVLRWDACSEAAAPRQAWLLQP